MKKVSVEKMKEYLWYAMQFETYVYIWTKAMNQANNEMEGVYTERKRLQNKKREADAARQQIADKYAKKSEKDQKRVIEQISELEERIRVCKWRRFKFLALALVFGLLAIVLTKLFIKHSGIDLSTAEAFRDNGLPVTFLGFVLLIPCIIFIIRFLVDNLRLKNAIKRLPELRRAEPKDYSDRVNEEMTKVTMSVSETDYDLADLDRREVALTTHQERVFLELQNAKKILSNIYALDIIHRDYRDFVAISTMYGYLDRGVCTVLEGHGGIYHTFEKDLQMKAIIRNLQDLNAAMDRVEANQRVLISQMRTANKHLEGMSKSLENIDYNTQRIADNTAMIAVSSQQAAAELKWQSYQMWING